MNSRHPWIALTFFTALSALTASGHAEDWHGWRGPQQNGHSTETGLPSQWNAGSVAWKVDLPGSGQSSPVTHGNLIFLTSSLDGGNRRVVLAVDREKKEIAWQKEVWKGKAEPSHNMNGWASATCATDGQVVIAFFGKGGLHSFDMSGNPLWSRDLGIFSGPWGTAACPVIWNDLVIQNCDADQDSFLIAVNKNTGKTVWKVQRPEFRGWSTPVLVKSGGRDELVLNGQIGTIAYAPKSGETLWTVQCPRGRGTPTVTPHDDLLYVVNGLGGGGAYCVKPGGSGDVTDSHRVWFSERRSRDLPSPIIVDDTMLVMSLRGAILSGYDTETGKELWKERVGGQISASPVAFGGKAYFVAEDGTTVVVDPSDNRHVIGRNKLETSSDEEIFRSTITPSNGQLLIRSTKTLYCIED